MGKKLTYDFVKAKFEEEGYTLISDSYVNSTAKLQCRCNKGHDCFITWNDFQQGSRCFECNGTPKHTYEFIKNAFESKGYSLLTKVYVNANTKLEYVCSNGHTHSMSYNKFSLGVECPFCQGTVKYSYEQVKDSFSKRGCKLLSTDYVNSMTKLDYECSNGHCHSITFAHFLNGVGCPYCAGNAKLDYNVVKSGFETEGYTLVSTEYVNSKTKLNYKCNKGHTHSITWSDWISGYRCPVCHIERISGSGNCNWGGGLTTDPYCDAWKDKDYKYSVRERDGHRCLNPYCISDHPEDLNIHHINYNKQDCHPKNLITVCRSCNAKANTDRDWHQSWYQAILMRRYNYKY